MTQVIGVTYLFVPTGVVDTWHLVLLYDDGAGQKMAIEVRPQTSA